MSATWDPELPHGSTAAERTDLAWNRSGLALLAAGAIVVKGVPAISGVPASPVAGTVMVGLGAATWALGAVQARRRSRPGRPRRAASSANLLPVALGTATIGVAAFALAVVHA